VRPFLRLSGGFRWNLHQYISTILRSYGFRDWFVERIKSMYEEAAFSIQIKGHVTEPFPIQSSVRQGCLMSMLLFAFCMDPLFHISDRKLPGIGIGKPDKRQWWWHTLTISPSL